MRVLVAILFYFIWKLHAVVITWNQLEISILQGTGSAGATVRIYIEQFEPDVSKHDMDAQIALKPLIG